MTARDDLKIFANTVDIDPIEGTPNKLSISDDLWNLGWLRTNPVAAQHLNQALYLITKVLKEDTLSPALNLSDVDDAATARANLGIVYPDISNLLVDSNNLSDLTNVPTARDNLGLNIDTLFNTFFDKIYPVGSVYENKTNSANPNTYLGRGTWVVEGAGRVAIGSGSGTDINSTVQNFTSGSTGGEYTHTLTIGEIPAHKHTTYYAENGATILYPNGAEFTSGKNGPSAPVDADNAWPYTSTEGGGNAHNNVQPYVVYNRWLRTA